MVIDIKVGMTVWVRNGRKAMYVLGITAVGLWRCIYFDGSIFVEGLFDKNDLTDIAPFVPSFQQRIAEEKNKAVIEAMKYEQKL